MFARFDHFHPETPRSTARGACTSGGTARNPTKPGRSSASLRLRLGLLGRPGIRRLQAIDHLGDRLFELARRGLAHELVADHTVLIEDEHDGIARYLPRLGDRPLLAVGPA